MTEGIGSKPEGERPPRGVFGGSAWRIGRVAGIDLAVDQSFYWISVHEALTTPEHFLPFDVYVGLFKALVFGILIATVSCAAGLRARGGALGVGLAVQQAVRNSVILIIVVGFILTWFFYFLGE